MLKCHLLLSWEPGRGDWLEQAKPSIPPAVAHLGVLDVEMMVLWLRSIWVFIPMATNQMDRAALAMWLS